MATSLKAINYFKQVLTTPYTAGSGTLTVPDATNLGTLSATSAVVLTTFAAANPTVPLANYRVESRAGNVLTLTSLTWGADTSLSVGDIVALTPTAELIQDVQAVADAAVTGPAGSNTQVQFNDGGTLAGATGLTWDKLNWSLAIGSTGLGNGAQFHTHADQGNNNGFIIHHTAGDYGQNGVNAIGFFPKRDNGYIGVFLNSDTGCAFTFASANTASPFADFTVTPTSGLAISGRAAYPVLTVHGSASQSADTFRVEDSASAALFTVDQNGYPVIKSGAGAPAGTPADGGLYVDTTNNAFYFRSGGAWVTPSGGGGSGTVTSVGLALPSIFIVSGSPVTTTGTLTGSLATQGANTVFAGPASGIDTAPTFRALVAADIPSLDAAKIATGTVAVARLPVMVGDAGSGGTAGLVPAPAIGDATKYLKGDGTWAAVTGSGSPGGADTQVQYNAAGAFAGDSGLTYNATSNTLTVGDATAGQLIIDINNTEPFLPAGSHLYLKNSNASGQNVVASYINGSLAAKWRTDYQNNVNWVSGSGGSHIFYNNGDAGTGTALMCIHTAGVVGIGTGTQANQPVGQLNVKALSAGNAILVLDGITAQGGAMVTMRGVTSTSDTRDMGVIDTAWADSTDTTRKGRLTLSAKDATAAREGVRIEASGTAALLGFFGGTAAAKPTITGSRGGNAALAGLLTALAGLGLITDSTTA